MKQFDINLIINLQRTLRTGFLDWFFYIISFLGSEYLFLGVAALLFWCVNKRFAFKFINIFFLGQLLTGIIKVLVGRTRPFDNGAQAVKSRAGGYSFPSGHSQGIANIATQLSLEAKNDKIFVRTLAAIAVVLVMFSRMYLGQHYLTDVICGMILGVLIAVLFTKIFNLLGNKEELLAVIFLPLTVILTAIVIGINKHHEDSAKIFGAIGAVMLGYFLEKRYVKYEVKSGGILNQCIKVVLGLGVLLGLKEGIGFLADKADLSGRLVAFLDYLRYFLIGITAMLALPAFYKKIHL